MSTMTFINLPVKDLERTTEFDELVGKALAAGAEGLGDPQDDGFMYMRGFRDPDGHQWSFIHMDMSALGWRRDA